METNPELRAEAAQALKDRGLDFSEETFLDRIGAGDLPAVDLFLGAGMTAAWDPKRPGPMTAAVLGANPALVSRLLQAGGDPDERDEAQTPALVLAVSELNEPIVELLLGAGASIDAGAKGGTTALMAASAAGLNGAVAALLQRGASTDALDEDRRSALMLAARSGRAEAAELLLRKGASFALKDAAGQTAMDLATGGHHAGVVQLLRKAERGEFAKKEPQAGKAKKGRGSSVLGEGGIGTAKPILLAVLVTVLAVLAALNLSGRFSLAPKLPSYLDPPVEEAATRTLQFGVETIEGYRIQNGKPPASLAEVYLEGRGVPFVYKVFPDGHYTLSVSLLGKSLSYDSSKSQGTVTDFSGSRAPKGGTP